jgi:Carboxypeptidase regulatory-like domain
MQRAVFFLVILLSSVFANAQKTGFTQTIKGIVTDEQSGNILPNTTIAIDNPLLQLNALTDEKGNFKITHIPIGRQSIRVSAMGYQEIIIPNIEITSSKEVVLEIRLKENVQR